jgi:hypothetical protein
MASKKRAAKKAKTLRDVLAPFGFPRPAGPGLCFDDAGDRLFARGHPHLRLLTDAAIAPAAAEKLALEALDAIDPTLRLAVPRAVARQFLLGYRVAPLLFEDRPGTEAARAERLALMRSDRAIDVALLEESLRQPHAWGMGETYSRWRWPEVLYLYEAFVGSEPVARAVADYLFASATDPDRWGFAANDPNRRNSVHHWIAAAFPWLLLRVEPAVARDLRIRLTEVPRSARVPGFVELLHWIGAPQGSPPPGFALETLEGEGLGAMLASDPHAFVHHAARVAWLFGTERFGEPVKIAGYDLPRLVDSVAPLRDPGIVALITAASAQRAGRKPAGEWLARNAAFARPIVQALTASANAKEAAAATGALELMKATAIEEAPVMSDDDLEYAIQRIFGALEKKLRATKARTRQIKAIREAYEAYIEARAAAGDPIPEAYFTHRFGDFGLGEFGMLAVDAIE